VDGDAGGTGLATEELIHLTSHDDGPTERRSLEPLQAFAELARLDLRSTPLGEVLRHVAELALATFPAVDEVSVSLLDGEHARSVAFTGDLAIHLDERQYESGFGPCLDAARTGTVVPVRDTAGESRYTDFAEVARRAGIGSSLSVGMPTVRRVRGGLNLYSGSAGAFDERTVRLARAFADYAAVAMANAALVDEASATAAQLQEALTSRVVIEQAKGALAVRHGCTPDQAFQHLLRDSRNANRKLREVAAEVVATLG
jgi:GAF domain-containing protein